jgi:hypothetical protein
VTNIIHIYNASTFAIINNQQSCTKRKFSAKQCELLPVAISFGRRATRNRTRHADGLSESGALPAMAKVLAAGFSCEK